MTAVRFGFTMARGAVATMALATVVMTLVAGCAAPDRTPTPASAAHTAVEQLPSAPSPSDPAPRTPSRRTPAPRTPPPAGALHVHLGDSYAAGTGLRPLVTDSPFPCLRAQGNYGRLVSARFGWSTADVSCAGATVANLTRGQYEGVGPQLEALSAQTSVVTLTVGGNDGDVFATAVGECARLGRSDPDGAPCRDVVDRMREVIGDETGPALAEGLRAITARAPNARVYLAGYPWLVPPAGTCTDDAFTFAAGDLGALHRLNAALNDALRAAAGRVDRVRFVDTARASVGHTVCADPAQRWIAPPGSGAASMHPTAAGQQAIADAVAAALDAER